jgi:hypothetical protein
VAVDDLGAVMSEATSSPEAVTILGAAAFFLVLGVAALLAMLTPHVRYWHRMRRTDRDVRRSIDEWAKVSEVLP